jgi:hypothetical protein
MPWLAAFGLMFILILPATSVQAQAVDRGRVMIDLYYGFPNLWSGTLRTLVNEFQAPIDLQTRSVGPMGGRIEYLVTRRVGVALDVYYARSEVSYTAQGQDLEGIPPLTATRFPCPDHVWWYAATSTWAIHPLSIPISRSGWATAGPGLSFARRIPILTGTRSGFRSPFPWPTDWDSGPGSCSPALWG